MNEPDNTMETFAAYGIAPSHIAALLASLRPQLAGEVFYVFQAGSATGANGAGGTGKPRTLLAFASPDSALLFAQRNGLIKDETPPRLRAVPIPRLLLAMAVGPNIRALLFVPDSSDPQRGRMPEGVVVERAALGGAA